MADTKITALSALTAADPANDVLPIVDVNDPFMAASGTTKKISINNILGASGTATLASATITGNLTVSAGTVNGVGYLNASKVLTAGSALVFDGTNLGVGGTGQLRFATSGGAIGDNSIGTENSFSMMLRCGRGSTSNIELASDKLVFGTAASERYKIDSTGVATWSNVGGVANTAMTLNATGLGVGRTPSTYKLEVLGNAQVIQSNFSDVAFRISQGASTSGNKGQLLFTDSSGTTAYITGYGSAFGSGLSGALAIGVGASDRLIVDTSGNVGIGVASPSYNLDVRAAAATANVQSSTGTNAVSISARNTGGTLTLGKENSVGGGSGEFGQDAYASVLWSTGAYPLVFGTNASHRLKIDSVGNMIPIIQTTAPTLTLNGQMVFNLTSDTNLRISVRGSDGTTRTANITLA